MEPLIHDLLNPRCYPEPVSTVEVLETHISWVLLAGEHAYKIKKPVDLGFLDFSTLEKRHHACREELRLNRRLAPDLYLDVRAILANGQLPCFGDETTPGAVEYAVRMRRFAQEARLDHQLEAGLLTASDMDALAGRVAQFHEQIPGAGDDSPYGEPPAVHATVRENFAQIEPLLSSETERHTLRSAAAMAERSFTTVHGALTRRKADGCIRECHGDLHLANLARLSSGITAFDCIEFNPALRWIDVISEAAFLVMDLHHRGRMDFAFRFLNAYLQITGDYESVAVLPYYLAYRAMVRAKVAAIESGQKNRSHDIPHREYQAYVELAQRLGNPSTGAVILTHGLSGSGKTWVSQGLLELLPAIRVRSDVERKRLFGLGADAPSRSAVDDGLYTAAANERTYARLAALARLIAGAGYPALVDATFLDQNRRRSFVELADTLGVPFAIVDCRAPEPLLRRRITARSGDASEADLTVLERQLRGYEGLSESEQAVTLTVDTAGKPDLVGCAHTLRTRLRL